jgi:galactokinase
MAMSSAIVREQGNRRAIIEGLRAEFRRLYGGEPEVFRAPGRVNLIGDHTDYNDGLVMPMALEFGTYVAVSAHDDQRVRIRSRNFDESVEFRLSEIRAPQSGHWSNYVRGVAGVLLAEGIPLRGADLLIDSNVPIGAGLSSSAAIEVASALAFLASAGASMEMIKVALVSQRAEHEYVDTMCGIMDQFISCFGQANRALMLDCRSLEYEALLVPEEVRVVVCNTKVKHDHASGSYNDRRRDCEAGVRTMRAHGLPDIRALRDVSMRDLDGCREWLPETVYRRCRHVITENARVAAASAALKTQDLKSFGELMYESHASLRDDYEVSCKELDVMVKIARGLPGVYGARMTGGGFGGCTVNFVPAPAVQDFVAMVEREYARITGVTPEVYVCVPGDGAGPVMDEPA